MLFHVSAKQSIDSCLISTSLSLVPLNDIPIDAKRYLLLSPDWFKSSPDDSSGEHLRWDFWIIREVYVLIGHAGQTLIISLVSR
jgi:hypothetical protein